MVYATRTLFQLLSQDQYCHKLPIGIIEDYPSYEKRMVLIDVARKFFTIDELKDFIKIMSWVKMNELHLHLNDNGFYGEFSAYRLESEKYPDLTAKDGHYTWEEIKDLQEFASIYGITITPEIDSPGHSLAFTKIRPDLKSKWLNGNYLDITNPDTYTFIEEIFDEVIPHFNAPDFHIGTDEYRINSIRNDSLKYLIGDTFRKYINRCNKMVKKHGKVTRIWSGYEHMPGETEIDKDIVIDMWETSDAKNKSDLGYQFINSTHYYTYIVPGAGYYGVNNKFIYNKWTPEIFSNKEEDNLVKGDKGLLGSKMHIWNDCGPSGYTTSEIARLSTPSIMVFSEKMWGTKSEIKYEEYEKELEKISHIPLTSILDRNFATEEVIYSNEKGINLDHLKSISINKPIKYLEYPWTIEMDIIQKKKSTKKDILLTSDLATLYADLEYDFKDKKVTITKRGVALVRSTGKLGQTPLTSKNPKVIIFDYQIPLNKDIKLKIVGEENKTSLYIDNKLIDSKNIQMLCPTEYLGSEEGESFKGYIKNISILKD
jgi:hexosaminidase